MPGPTSLHATEGLLYDGQVGTFTDGNSADAAANFTATIVWGDNTSSTGTVTGSAGRFSVSGQHTYAEEGNFPLSAVVTDNQGHSITLGGPPQWTQLAAGLPPASIDALRSSAGQISLRPLAQTARSMRSEVLSTPLLGVAV